LSITNRKVTLRTGATLDVQEEGANTATAVHPVKCVQWWQWWC